LKEDAKELWNKVVDKLDKEENKKTHRRRKIQNN
jgi:hypothetical protein